ncbi:MAG: tetratricopeptide repeat protein [Acidobacteria bacterium]|nr:tetratricopeptide repeat protein [Acidobacteriota bacterium]
MARMLGEQLRILGLFFINPKKASSLTLDQGSAIFAAIAAIAITLAISIPASSLERVEMQLVQARLAEMPPAEAQHLYAAAMKPFDRRYYASGFSSLIAMAAFFVPVSIILLASLAHLGGAMTVLFRDYMPALCGLLFAWTAAHVPVAVFWWIGAVPLSPGTPFVLYSQVLGLGLFTGLATVVLSTVTGASPGESATASVVSIPIAGAIAYFVSASNLSYLFFSPWILYFLYQRFARDMGALGGGLSARQNFKRQLDAATLNPRDADARYQLGLIYVQRRDFGNAEARFREAIAIDPNEADSLFQLGRILRQKPETAKEALQLLERAATINPKLANYEVWRELGAACLATGDAAEALAHLEPYIKAREYDAEGLVLLGQALRKCNREAEAKAAFERAIEAARTAPDFRRGEVKQWERQARQELR